MSLSLKDAFVYGEAVNAFRLFLGTTSENFQGAAWWNVVCNYIAGELLASDPTLNEQIRRLLFISRLEAAVSRAISADQGIPSDELLVDTAAKIIGSYPDLAAYLVNSFLVEPEGVRQLAMCYIAQGAGRIGAGRDGIHLSSCQAWLGQVRLVCSMIGYELTPADLPWEAMLRLAAADFTNVLFPGGPLDPVTGWKVLRKLDALAAAAQMKVEDLLRAHLECPPALQVLVLALCCHRHQIESPPLLGLDIRNTYIRRTLDLVIAAMDRDVGRHRLNSAERYQAEALLRWTQKQRGD